MRTRKTRLEDRGVYKYHRYVLDQYGKHVKEEIVIRPGEDGVTELDIQNLHKMDDSEVYYNNKNLRPGRTDEDKKEIKAWKEDFSRRFEEEHGYAPTNDDVEAAVEEYFPRNYNLSLDYVSDDGEKEVDLDKSRIALLVSTDNTQDELWSDRMLEVIELMTDKQKEVLNLIAVDGYHQTEVAKMLGISVPAVNKHYKKALDVIKKNYKK